MTTEEKELLEWAKLEIISLRRREEISKARLNMFDNIMILLNTRLVYESSGMSPDVVSAIEKILFENRNVKTTSTDQQPTDNDRNF